MISEHNKNLSTINWS